MKKIFNFLVITTALNVSAFTISSKPKRIQLLRSTKSSTESSSNVPIVKLTPEAQELEDILQKKGKGGKLIVAQTAPSVRVAVSELFQEPPGAFSPSVLVASLKALGFDVVLDTNTAADLTICEEGTELLHRILDREERRKSAEDPSFNEAIHTNEPLPLFTSCCPGWMNYLQKSNPELIPFISSCKSPHLMYGAMVKNFSEDLFGRDAKDIYLTSVMPCVLKKGETEHESFIHSGVHDVDNVITTKDLGDLLHLHEIDPTTLAPLPYDSPFQVEKDSPDGKGSGAGQLFGVTGGVMEASVRTVYEILTGSELPRLDLKEVRGLEGIKEAKIPLFNDKTGKGLHTELRVAVANGLGNAKKLIKAMKDGEAKYDFVEVMACNGGCIGGGGQPRSADKDVLGKRMEVIYKLDKALPIRRSHENPTVKVFYDRFLDSYGSEKAHRVLHVDPIYGNDQNSEKKDAKEIR
jgi:iron-only hydrogenase group A